MPRSTKIAAVGLASSIFFFAVSHAFAAGKITCERITQPIQAGEYEIVIVEKPTQELTRYVQAVVDFTTHRDHHLVHDVQFKFRSLTTAVSARYHIMQPTNPDSHTAYVIVGSTDSSLAQVQNGKLEKSPKVFIPAFEELRLSAENPPIKEKDYYQFAAIHAARSILLYWSKESDKPINNITLDHLVSSSNDASIMQAKVALSEQ